MGTTPTYGFPYPELTDDDNPPADIKALALAIEDEIGAGGSITWTTKMQADRAAPVPSGSTAVTVAVIFPVPFATIPAVVCTPNDANLTLPRVTVVSTTGFSVRWERAAAGTYTYNWIAMVP